MKKISAPKDAANNKNLDNNSTTGQCRRLEKALRDKPEGLTSIQIYEQLNILRPSARISEMRWDKGLNIKTINTHDITANGHTHQNARYVLFPGKWDGRKSA
jgi:hypothetical protein